MASLSSHVEAARSALLSEDYGATTRLCLRILEHYPRHVETYALLAEAYRELGLRDEAEELFRCVVSADPEHLIARWGLSLLCEARGDMAAATSHLRVAIDLAPGIPALRPELQRLTNGADDGTRLTPAGLARLWSRTGMADRALRIYDGVLAAQSHRLDVQVALAELLWRSAERDLAVALAQRILQDSPDCLKANLLVARALELEGRPDEAAPYRARAEAIDPEGIVQVDLFGADGGRRRDATLPDPGAPADLPAAVDAEADAGLSPTGASPTADAMPRLVGPSLRPESPTRAREEFDPATAQPDDWMELDDRELDLVPSEADFASAEELAAFEASLLAGDAALPAPAAPVPAHGAIAAAAARSEATDDRLPLPEPRVTDAGGDALAPAASPSPRPAPAGPPGPPAAELAGTPLADWLGPVAEPAAPPAPAARPQPVAAAPPAAAVDSEWAKLLTEEIELDAGQQDRLRAALAEAGLTPPKTPAKAPPVSLRPAAQRAAPADESETLMAGDEWGDSGERRAHRADRGFR